ncbi:MAG: 16S rRNA m(2)G966 methyltransferase [Sodalis sp. Ffu]|nr:MAG: 16S rRNA m(2)G966 methyltransferase [Sodalis sp. Ffu]
MKQKPLFLTGQIRIIGGQWRGRKLPVLDSPGLRPTPARVRETLFNWLSPVIQGARCLDCFAGSGALSFEALSRHAANITLLEQDHVVSVQLDKTLELLQTQEAQVVNTDSLCWLDQPGDTYDVVFIDPPFRQKMIDKTIKLLKRHHRLASNAWIYIETETEGSIPDVPPSWRLHRENIAGQVAYRLYCVTTNYKESYQY